MADYSSQPRLPDSKFREQYGGMCVDEDTEATTPEEVDALRAYLEGRVASVKEAARELVDELARRQVPSHRSLS